MSERRLPDVLVGADWLEAHLGDPDLRVVECTTYLEPADPDEGVPYHPRAGRSEFEAAHIPGAVFADLVDDLSRPDASVHFMLPKAADFAAAMGRLGIGDGTVAVIYSRDRMMWSTRLWWMLHVMGFDDAAVLDGGFEAWTLTGRPVEPGPSTAAPAVFTPRPRDGRMVDQRFVQSALGDSSTLLVNTLTETDFRGLGPSRYGRPGRIPGSVNVPWPDLVDAETGRFMPLEAARARLEAAGTSFAKEVVCYCGGGISATSALFQLHRLGHRNLRLYDASLAEWARDDRLPIEHD